MHLEPVLRRCCRVHMRLLHRTVSCAIDKLQHQPCMCRLAALFQLQMTSLKQGCMACRGDLLCAAGRYPHQGAGQSGGRADCRGPHHLHASVLWPACGRPCVPWHWLRTGKLLAAGICLQSMHAPTAPFLNHVSSPMLKQNALAHLYFTSWAHVRTSM